MREDGGEVGHCGEDCEDAYECVEREWGADIHQSQDSANAANDQGSVERVPEAWRYFRNEWGERNSVVTCHCPEHTACCDVGSWNSHDIVDEENDEEGSGCWTRVTGCLVVDRGQGELVDGAREDIVN